MSLRKFCRRSWMFWKTIFRKTTTKNCDSNLIGCKTINLRHHLCFVDISRVFFSRISFCFFFMIGLKRKVISNAQVCRKFQFHHLNHRLKIIRLSKYMYVRMFRKIASFSMKYRIRYLVRQLNMANITRIYLN